MRRALAILITLLVPVSAAAIMAYGPDGPPTLERLSRRAQCIVVATVHIGPMTSWWSDTLQSEAGHTRLPPLLLTRVTLVVEREIASDTTKSDTVYSYMRGGAFTNDKGQPSGVWVEDEAFTECYCNGQRCVLFLRPEERPPFAVPGGRIYRPIDPFRAILPIGADGKVSRVPVKPEKTTILSLEKCIRMIEAARRRR